MQSFDYAVDLAKYLKLSKVTVSKYLNKGLLYNNIYYFKINPLKYRIYYLTIIYNFGI